MKLGKRKVKNYEQKFIRTMYFQKCETFWIDGIEYVVSNSASVDYYNCKTQIYYIWNHVAGIEDCDENTYTGWKKEMVKLLKDFDKKYFKHSKGVS